VPITPATAVATGAAAVYATAKILVRPPAPEPGYHLAHRHGDVVGETIIFCLGGAALVITARAFARRWHNRFVL